ncbi:Cysteine-rich/pacifastin venom protein 2 [Operophtera brumata]|uniref:Cysteine-rich/pacifastin venom protein 2 n=1 Tax=Operophtera brumata TaxID=104452 RepID=A0A0L7KW74_OPEBR|nr:Cysteine-rich/pacifastin venom protein 2 [Operophtera brumata]
MFIKDCNTCWCNADGTSFFCTRRVCIEMSDDAEDPNQELSLRVVEKECTPNELFEMDCNMCRCNDDGKSFSCTRRACIEIDDKIFELAPCISIDTTESIALSCDPGSVFDRDCNVCRCTSDGHHATCTLKRCQKDTDVTSTDTTESIVLSCDPGSVFDRDCNVCRCTSDGHHATCTLKRCQKDTDVTSTEPSQAFRCTPGDQFRRDCNDCTCSADGKNVFCTVRLCDEVLEEITP